MEGDIIGGVPGTVCDPGLCPELLTKSCAEFSGDMALSVRSVGPEYTSAFLMSDGEVIASTREEDGGRIRDGFECNSVILDFGTPLPEIGEPGMVIYVNSVVNVGGEPVETSYKVTL